MTLPLTNGYTNKKRRRDILLGGQPRETWFDLNKSKTIVALANCKCGRSIYDHPQVTIGDHYISFPYHGDLCPFLQLKE